MYTSNELLIIEQIASFFQLLTWKVCLYLCLYISCHITSLEQGVIDALYVIITHQAESSPANKNNG